MELIEALEVVDKELKEAQRPGGIDAGKVMLATLKVGKILQQLRNKHSNHPETQTHYAVGAEIINDEYSTQNRDKPDCFQCGMADPYHTDNCKSKLY